MKSIIQKKSYIKLLLIIFTVFLLFSLLSSFILFYILKTPLGPHYGAVIAVVTKFKETMIIKTVMINFIFWIFSAMGVALLGILYSHRIAGPLFKVKQYAAMLGQGKFDERISFRKKDAVHPLSIELNKLAQGFKDKVEPASENLSRLEADLLLLDTLPDKSPEKYDLIKRLKETDLRIINDYGKVKS